MPGKLSHRLSATDAAFLYVERPNAPLHIGSAGIYQGQIEYERFVAHIDSRMPLIPRYRQRLAFVPFSIAHPTWEDDPDFNVRRHIFHAEVPAPGTEEQLRELMTMIFAVPLDRSKPLWEMYVINGLEGDRSAILSKVHHCMVDGVSGIELLLAVVDISPEPAPPPEAEAWHPQPMPGPAQRVVDAFWDNVSEQVQVGREAMENVLVRPRSSWKETEEAMRALRNTLPMMMRQAPRTPFSTPLSRERKLAVTEVSFPEIREIRTALGGTVNDVVLAVLAGALRSYLLAHGHDVDGLELRIGVPVNVRLENEQGTLGNRISAMFPMVPVGEPDAAARLRLIKDQVDHMKKENQPGLTALAIRLGSFVPVPLQAIGTVPNTFVNIICTNVPGPMIPLYSVGHLLLAHYPLVPLSLDMGLGVGVTSYNQKLFFGLMSDPQALPDIDLLRRYVDQSFFDLRKAAGVEPSDLPSFNGHSRKTAGVVEMGREPAPEPAS